MPSVQFSGLASGIDSAALIDSLIEARQITNKFRREEIEQKESSNTALSELKTKLADLDKLLEPFRSASGGGVRKKASSSTTTVATAVAGSNATNSSYAVNVVSTAKSATGSLYNSGGYSALTSVFQAGVGSGNVEITVGQGSEERTISVDVTRGDTTVQEVIDAINSDSEAQGRLSAVAVNTGTTASPNYQIVLNTLEQGESLGTLAVQLTGLAALNVSTISQASDAEFSVSGINGNITRSSNTISDVIPGVTLQLATNGTTTVSVGTDADGTTDAMKEIVEAYNDIVEFITTNDAVTIESKSSGNVITRGSLAITNVDDDFLAKFRSDISSATSENGTSATTMSLIGISTNRDGTLSFDEDVFRAAVGSDLTGVSEVMRDFADRSSGVLGTIYQFTKFQGSIDLAITTNNTAIETLNKSIERLERSSGELRNTLNLRFARLERLVGDLQNQQNALSGVLAGLSAG